MDCYPYSSTCANESAPNYVGSLLVINSFDGLLVDKERSADSSITWTLAS